MVEVISRGNLWYWIVGLAIVYTWQVRFYDNLDFVTSSNLLHRLCGRCPSGVAYLNNQPRFLGPNESLPWWWRDDVDIKLMPKPGANPGRGGGNVSDRLSFGERQQPQIFHACLKRTDLIHK